MKVKPTLKDMPEAQQKATIRALDKLHSNIQDVPIAKMRVSPNAQRKLRPHRVAFLLEFFNLELLGYPVMSFREGVYWIVDGQHRVAALKEFLDEDWEQQSLTCRVYNGMTEQQEADMFDWLNNILPVAALDKFNTRVTARRVIESDVKKVVEAAGLRISLDKNDGCVGAVNTLVKVATRNNPATLGRCLRIAHRSFGDVGLTAPVIDGLARVCDRYNGQLNDAEAVERLNTMRGGVGALMGRADVLRKQTRRHIPECVAAAIVDILNSRRGGKKLPSWWTQPEAE